MLIWSIFSFYFGDYIRKQTSFVIDPLWKVEVSFWHLLHLFEPLKDINVSDVEQTSSKEQIKKTWKHEIISMNLHFITIFQIKVPKTLVKPFWASCTWFYSVIWIRSCLAQTLKFLIMCCFNVFITYFLRL